jgi:predicted RNA-binding Zn-ribbon protein involved in translation (DUF1610 family)
MTLSTIKQKIDTRVYQSVREFVRDFALISFNAQAFNRPDSSAYRDALIVERESKDQLRRLVERGVIEEEDLILPDLIEEEDYDDSPDRSYGFDGPRSETLLAMDANMRSLREEQNNAGNLLLDKTPTEQPISQSKNIPAEDTDEKHAPGFEPHILGIEPSKLWDLIYDIGDVTDRLEVLQNRHSKNQQDLPETIDQLVRLSDSFKRLAELQENADYYLRSQHVQENIHVLCSSVQHTIATALDTLHPPLRETQWMALNSSLRYIEPVDLLERLHWYRSALMRLLDHLNNSTSERLLDVDPKIRDLLVLQRSVKWSGNNTKPIKASGNEQIGPSPEASTPDTCYTCHAKLPDDPATTAGICPDCGSWYIGNSGTTSENIETKEAEPANATVSSDSPDATQPHPRASTPWPLIRLIASTSRVLNILQPLQKHHSRYATIVPEITDDLASLLASFQNLSQLHENPQYEPNIVKLQEPIQVLCRSMQHTLDAMLRVLTAQLSSDEEMLTQLTILTARMAGDEMVGLPERLRWYSASVLGLLNHLDGFPSAGRIFQWLGMDEKVRSLLERQEGSRV